MKPQDHERYAERIERSMRKLPHEEHELLVEGAMLAGAHRLNAHLHRLGMTARDEDLMHTYLLTVNEFRRLAVADGEALRALAAIEDLRPAYVRGNHPGGADAARRALQLLADLRGRTQASTSSTEDYS